MEKSTIILISNCFQAVAEVLKTAARTTSVSPEMEIKKAESAPQKVAPEPEEEQKTSSSGVKKKSGRGRPKKSETKPKEEEQKEEDTEVEIETPKTASGVDDFGDDFDEFNDGLHFWEHATRSKVAFLNKFLRQSDSHLTQPLLIRLIEINSHLFNCC